MWLDELKPGDTWMGVWKKKFHCSQCWAIIDEFVCPICNFSHPSEQTIERNGDIITMPASFMGAINWSTYMLLQLMQREWERPQLPEDILSIHGKDVPQRVIVVILFWSLFENLIETLLRHGLKHIPSNITEDLLKRYSSIGSRKDQLYKIAFSANFKQDLTDLGYGYVYDHLMLVQNKRNQFIHGNPEGINEDLVNETVRFLQEAQQAWILLYNKRCAKPNQNPE